MTFSWADLLPKLSQDYCSSLKIILFVVQLPSSIPLYPHLFLSSSFRLSRLFLSIYLSIDVLIYLSTYLSMFLAISNSRNYCLFVCLAFCLPPYLSLSEVLLSSSIPNFSLCLYPYLSVVFGCGESS